MCHVDSPKSCRLCQLRSTNGASERGQRGVTPKAQLCALRPIADVNSCFLAPKEEVAISECKRQIENDAAPPQRIPRTRYLSPGSDDYAKCRVDEQPQCDHSPTFAIDKKTRAP